VSAFLKLIAIDGDLKGATFEFRGTGEVVVGRSRDCTVKLPESDLAVSRHHCMFTIDDRGVAVYDLGSRNGTFVNGTEVPGRRGAGPAPVEGWRLRDGDEICLGTTTLRAHVDPAQDDTVELVGVEDAAVLSI
jgi:pSer/pThr/pTyr-binding forkhead associated (FHA) protein